MKIYFYGCSHDDNLIRLHVENIPDPPLDHSIESAQHNVAFEKWKRWVENRDGCIRNTIKSLMETLGWEDSVILDQRDTMHNGYYVAVRFIGM